MKLDFIRPGKPAESWHVESASLADCEVSTKRPSSGSLPIDIVPFARKDWPFVFDG